MPTFRIGQQNAKEIEVLKIEAPLVKQEEASEEVVAGVEEAIREAEFGQAEADESEASEVEREPEEP